MSAGAPSIAAAVQWAQAQLEHSDTALLDSELLLGKVLARPRSYLRTWPERELAAPQWQQFQQLVEARASGRPVAHLLGQRDFWSLTLAVDDSTLIPRPATEHLVEATLELTLSADWPAELPVLDLGTGSGAIALALKKERPLWQLSAVDREAAALQLAQRNAELLQLTLQLKQSDWFSALAGQQFAIIVSNPPYIAADDPHLQRGDLRFEPRSALVAGVDGLADLVQICQQAAQHLWPQGWLLLEHGWQQGQAVRALLQQAGFVAVRSVLDYAGHERVSLGQWPGMQP